MTKECAVIINNDAVTVVRFDDIEIQFPSIHKKSKTVFVNFDNGRYSIVDKLFEDNVVGKKKNKKAIVVNADEVESDVLENNINE